MIDKLQYRKQTNNDRQITIQKTDNNDRQITIQKTGKQ
jgi:hypothetical protein